MVLSMKAFRGGQPGFDLLRGGVEVGWLREGIVGFLGFTSQRQAERAGAVAADALAHWYSTRWYSVPLPWQDDEPCKRPIKKDQMVIGRILAPHEIHADTISHQIELRIPRETWSAVMLELAQRTYTALTAAGLTTQAERSGAGVA
ncbi:hypothetical protein BH09GEM1_BH09GEM1_18980 [soil metagenome]